MTKKKHSDNTAAPLVLQRRLPRKGRLPYLLWQLGLLLLACAALSYFTLRLSPSNLNPEIWLGYWEDLWIPAINFALVFGLCLLLYALLGRAWLAYLLTALVALGIAIGNYYLIIIRSDALQFQDLSCLREALAITDTQGYELELNSTLLTSILAALGWTALLAVLSRWRPRWGRPRLVCLALAFVALCGVAAFGSTSAAVALTKHYDHVNTWSVTEIYASRGVVYSFVRTISYGSGRPSGYSEKDTAQTLAAYRDEAIPEDRKVDVFVIMRESYADLSDLDSDAGAIDWSCYDDYHSLADEALMVGNLVTNGFGGNTKDAERCFLTGNYSLREWRKPTNSYVWYLKQQGYTAEGAHPFNGWFYNRLNVDRYLGFDRYEFREDSFNALVGDDAIAEDDVLFEELWRMYEERDPAQPYFNFSVTYEGHGPYDYTRNKYSSRYVLRDANTPDGIAMNNYLSIAAHRDASLLKLVEKFRSSDRPIVLLTYGDHKATLGKEINNYTTAAYERYLMDLDLSTAEGFFNYYSTEYLIWLNDAARAQLGLTETGLEGPTVSPCYLMNVLFDALDWGDGPAYLQAMGDMMETFPVYSTKGRVSIEGELMTSVPSAYSEQYHLMQSLCYYWQTKFLYSALTE